MSLLTQDFFNEILSSIQRVIYEEINGITHKVIEDNYYYTPVDDYFTYSLKIGKHFSISPKDVYDTWSLPMVLVTYVYIHNEGVTEFGYQQDSMNSKTQKVIHYENNYIKNITVDMISEMEEREESSNFAPEHEALMAIYGGNN